MRTFTFVKPETVIRWREKKFRDFWRKKSQNMPGRPAIPDEHIDFIRGIAIPYGAPNAAAHAERLIGTLRREGLDRMLPCNERHLRHVLTEFLAWYNHGRVHQGLNGIPDPDPGLGEAKPAGGRLVAIPALNGLHHDYRLAA